MEQSRPAIGIDLGTAYIRVAVSDGTTCRMVPDEHGNSAMPSYVAFTNTGLLVGDAARLQASHNPNNTIFDVIRLIGRRYSHPSVRIDKRLWPFKVIAGPDEMLQVEVKWKGRLWQFNGVEICSMLLMQIKENAEKDLGTTITDAVITVPVCFNYAQRLAIKQAGMIAGLDFMQIISAPAASAFFYGLDRSSKSTNFISNILKSQTEGNIVIFDLGAGTVDVAVVTIKENACKVRATAGNLHLGGSDFDNNLVDHFVISSLMKREKDLSSIPMAISSLRTVSEKAKISLSSGSIVVPIKVTPLYNNVNFESSITEAKFNDLNNDLFKKCKDILVKCLRESEISVDAVDEVILAGGSATIPLVKKHIQSCFESMKLTISQHLKAATAYGAAFQAFFLCKKVNQRTLKLFLLDAAPSSLGLRSQGTMLVFVPKNMNIPVRIEKTIPSNRIPYPVEVYEGEKTLISQNNFLGICEFNSHISSNFSNINIIFEIQENGTLTVRAKEIPHGKWKSTTFISNKLEGSQYLLEKAFSYKESGKGNKASTTKSSTKNNPSCHWDKARDTKQLAKLMSIDKDNSFKIVQQSSRKYVEPKEYAIGIDFGTTYSRVAAWRRNSAEIIKNEYGSHLTCSVVAFTDTGRLIGDTIHKEQFIMSPANTIPNIKRLISRTCCSQSIQNDNRFQPFRVLCNDKNRSMVLVQYKNEEKLFSPEEIVAMILSKMREIAEAHLNSMVTKAVICVPASFGDSQRQAIKDAGAIAGLNVMQLLNEPTATAITYFLRKNSGQSSAEKTLLIFDFGGGNLDVSIVTIKKDNIRVQAFAGDSNLGGEDFDNNMMSHFVEKFMKENKRDIRNKPRSLRRLRAACEKAKIVLSTNAQTVVEIDALDEGVDFRTRITRKAFEEINVDLFKRSINCVEKCLEDAKMDKSCIDEVVLVGGSTRIPKMQLILQEFFDGKELCKSLNADEAVVYGAAVQAAILSGNQEREEFNILQLQDVTSLTLGMRNEDGAMMNLLIRKHSPVPTTKELIFTNCTDGLTSFSIQVQECELASTIVFSLSDITPKPMVKSEIIVSFEVDDSGILNLTAKDTSARKKTEIVISKENRGLTTEEIQKMVEAEARYKAEDEEHKKRAAALHSLENFVYEMKTIARDVGISAASKKKVDEVADNVITWLETNYQATIDEISAQRKKLETIKSQIVYLGTDADL